MILLAAGTAAWAAGSREKLWSLKPVVRPEIPSAFSNEKNPIDAFVRKRQQEKGLKSVGPAEKATLLRRLYLDLTGLPPSVPEAKAFLQDNSPDAYEKVVDRLLASEQHGVRYARHWLDVLRYADVDGGMPSDVGLYHWRDWMISALNRDLPYDRFVRAQIAGDVSGEADEIFATGFLARGAQSMEDKEQDLAFNAVETVSLAFAGMTVGCARCHDHMFDPISQRDFYSMKALFDPLVLDKKTLATAGQIFAYARAKDQYEKQKAILEAPLNELTAPYKKRLLEERITMLPPDVQAIIRKTEKERSPEERKIADDYAPVLRIDTKKILEVLSPEQRARHAELLKTVQALKEPPELPVFWAVREDSKKIEAKNHILLVGDPEKPGAEVTPGFPFSPAKVDFGAGRRQTFVNWLTDPENPLFARVAVNRLWQWHFGEGLVATANDFGYVGDKPSNPELLDWLASEFVARKYSMKEMHRLIVTSEAYKTASIGPADLMESNSKIDPRNLYLTRFHLERLEAEVIHDLIYSVSGELDPTVGGMSFRDGPEQKWTGGDKVIGDYDTRTNRRGIYMGRGYHGDADLLPAFLQTFDAEDGRRTCPRRNQTVTAPQALALMNSPMVVEHANQFAARLRKQSAGNLAGAVELGYLTALSRPPSPKERDAALSYIRQDPKRLDGFAWMLLNLDEFVYQQ
ncbi:MAG: DUF1549 and DUF1553 domain-containing protein [Bryobacteraceae bacterium]